MEVEEEDGGGAVYKVVTVKKFKPCARSCCCSKKRKKHADRGNDANVSFGPQSKSVGNNKGGRCSNLMRRLARASCWTYRHPTVRLLTMSAVLLLNVLLFSEDPQSYSNSDVSVPFLGQVFNFCFFGYPSPAMNPRWLALKCLLLITSILLGALAGEFLLRRLIFQKIFGFRGFKRDKGALVCAFLCALVALWFAVQLYVVAATARNSHALSFMHDWNPTDFKPESGASGKTSKEDLDADGRCDFEGPLIYDESSFSWKNMDRDVKRSIPSSNVPLSNGAFAMIAFYLTVLGDLYALFSIFDYMLQDRKNYANFCTCFKGPGGCWSPARIPVFWCFAVLCVSFVGAHFALSGFAKHGSLYWQGASFDDSFKKFPQPSKTVEFALGNDNYVAELSYACSSRRVDVNGSSDDRACEIFDKARVNRTWYADNFHVPSEKEPPPRTTCCLSQGINGSQACENARPTYRSRRTTELYRRSRSVATPPDRVDPCVAARSSGAPSEFRFEKAQVFSVDGLRSAGSLSETKADSPPGRGLFGTDELQRVYLAAFIFVLNLLVFTQDPEFAKIDTNVGTKAWKAARSEGDDGPLVPGLTTRSLEFPEFGMLSRCVGGSSPFCCGRRGSHELDENVRDQARDEELVDLSDAETPFWDSDDEISSPLSSETEPVRKKSRSASERKPKKNSKPFLTARWLTYSVLVLMTMLDAANLYSQASYVPADYGQVIDERGYLHSEVDVGDDAIQGSGEDVFRFHVLERVCPYSIEGGCVKPDCFEENPDGRALATERGDFETSWWLRYLGLDSDLPRVEHKAVLGATRLSKGSFLSKTRGFVVGPGKAASFYKSADPAAVRGFGKPEEHNSNDRRKHGFFARGEPCDFNDSAISERKEEAEQAVSEIKRNIFDGFLADVDRINDESLALGQIRWTDYKNGSGSDGSAVHEFRGWKCVCHKVYSVDFEPSRPFFGKSVRDPPNGELLGTSRDGTVGRCFFGDPSELQERTSKNAHLDISNLFVLEKKAETACDGAEYYEMILDDEEITSLLRAVFSEISSNNGTEFNATRVPRSFDVLEAVNSALWIRPVANLSEYPNYEIDYRCFGCTDQKNPRTSPDLAESTPDWNTLRYFGTAGIRNMPSDGLDGKAFFFSDACVDAQQLLSSSARLSNGACELLAEELERKKEAGVSLLPRVRILELSCKVTSGKLNSRYAGHPPSDKALPLTVSTIVLLCVVIRIAVHNALESLLKWNNKRRDSKQTLRQTLSTKEENRKELGLIVAKETSTIRKIKMRILRFLMCLCCKTRKEQYEFY